MAERVLTLRFTGDNTNALSDGTRDGFPHNAIAHPLLVLAPPLGRWLHTHTEPIVPTWRTRWAHTLDRIVPPGAVRLGNGGWSDEDNW